MDTQPISNCCPKCHAPLPADAPQGLCPKCLLAAVATPTEADQPAGRPAPPPLEEIAAAFPQLEILEFIGQGGMGFVFKARQPKLDRLVALKILPQSLAADPTFAERFNREARLLARLNHPGIVTVHDFGVAAGILPAVEPGILPGGKDVDRPGGIGSSEAIGISSASPGGKMLPSTSGKMPDATAASHLTSGTSHFYYLLMEFVDGVNLRQAMQAGRFTPEQALAIVPKICEALQFAHDHGILHRDIKPENILLDARGRVKIADFGIAKLVGGDTKRSADLRSGESLPPDSNMPGRRPALQLTETGKALGTPNYMAPEQLERPGEVDHRADIYSLGVVFYEMLTGELPLGRFAPPSQKSAADPRVDEVVLRALEKEKTRRYASADEVKTQVETIVTSSSRRAEAPSRIPSTGEQERKRGGIVIVGRRNGKRAIVWRGVSTTFFAIVGCLFITMMFIQFFVPIGVEPFIAAVILAAFVTVGGVIMGLRTPIELLAPIDDSASGSSRREEASSESGSRKAESGKPHQDFMTWSLFQSPEHQEICAHFTKAERKHVSVLSLLISVLVAGTCFGLPAFLRADFGKGKWIVAALWIILFAVSFRQFQQMMRHFLCSTAWAKERGFVPEKLRLFSFSRGKILTACALFAVLLALVFVQYQAMTRWLPTWPQTGTVAKTPPKKTPPAPEQRIPAQPPLTFGPVVERVIPLPKRDEACVLDFESGALVTPPDELAEKLAKDVPGLSGDDKSWLSANSADAALKPVGNLNHLLLFECSAGYMNQDGTAIRWEGTSSDSLKALREPLQLSFGHGFFYTDIDLAPGKPEVFAFLNREGGMGLLQITGFTENPRGVKIRYKLVQGQSVMAEATPECVLETIHGRTAFDKGERVNLGFRCQMPADHVLVFEMIQHSSNGVPQTAEELSAYMAGGDGTQPITFNLNVQDGGFLSPEARGRERWAISVQDGKNGSVVLPPVWTQKSGNRVWLTPGKGSVRLQVGQSAPFQLSQVGGKAEYELRVTHQALPAGLSMKKNLSVNSGTNWGVTVRQLESSPTPTGRLVSQPPFIEPALPSESPKLQFLAWEDEWRTNAPGAARHPDGSPVSNKDELAWLRYVNAASISPSSDAEAASRPRYLHLWFSQADSPGAGYMRVELLDEAGRPLKPSGTGGGSEMGPNTQNGQRNWSTRSFGLLPDQAGLSKITLRVHYTAGQIEQVREIASDQEAPKSLGGSLVLSGLGQDAQRRAFVAVALDDTEANVRRVSASAVTKTGKEVFPNGGRLGDSAYGTVATANFIFPFPLSDVDKFRISTFPIRTNEWKNVVLPGSNDKK